MEAKLNQIQELNLVQEWDKTFPKKRKSKSQQRLLSTIVTELL